MIISLIIYLVGFILIILIMLKIVVYVTLGKVKSYVCLIGKTVLITGGTSGLGYETALDLASRGARIIIADKNDAVDSKENIIKESRNENIVSKFVDLACLDSVRSFAKDINETEERLDILINNAGVGGMDHFYTEDDLEAIMQINHFGGFLLTHLLVDLIKKSGGGRIIFVSSISAFHNLLTIDNLNKSPDLKNDMIRTIVSYANSKLCNIIAANGFADKLKGTGITCNSLHPGSARTSIYQNCLDANRYSLVKLFMNNVFLRIFGKSPREGAQTQIHCAVEKELQNTTGEFFLDCRIFYQPPKAYDKEFSEKIWRRSEALVKLAQSEKL